MYLTAKVPQTMQEVVEEVAVEDLSQVRLVEAGAVVVEAEEEEKVLRQTEEMH